MTKTWADYRSICSSRVYRWEVWVWAKLDSELQEPKPLYHFTAPLYSLSVILLHTRTLFYLPFNLFFILRVPGFINQMMYFPRCTALYKLLLWGVCVSVCMSLLSSICVCRGSCETENKRRVYFSVEVWIWYIDTDPEYMLNRQIQSRHTWTQPSQREL